MVKGHFSWGTRNINHLWTRQVSRIRTYLNFVFGCVTPNVVGFPFRVRQTIDRQFLVTSSGFWPCCSYSHLPIFRMPFSVICVYVFTTIPLRVPIRVWLIFLQLWLLSAGATDQKNTAKILVREFYLKKWHTLRVDGISGLSRSWYWFISGVDYEITSAQNQSKLLQQMAQKK